MIPHTPPRLAAALVRLTAGGNDALVGDLEEQFRAGRSRRWYWSQAARMTLGRCLDDRRLQIVATIAGLLAAGVSVGWWGTSRIAVPVLLGFTFTSWKLWRLHRTSLVLLYASSVALLLPEWMVGSTLLMNSGDRLFWAIARVLAGYGVVGVLMVPFLILRLGRSGPLAERPISLSLVR
ncbi:MAG TPA: hypothetical protein VGJ78_09270 [Vicinamibacterales bacterium]|jgi:hypothetical protein